MAQIISTYDGFALSGHIARGQLQSSIPIQTGVVESFKQELECSINPLATNQVTVGTGMGIAGYLAWENSEQHMLEFFGNGTYNIVCTIDATNNPATIAIEYLPTSTTLITENLVANPNGIHQQLLATATIVSGTVDTLVDKRSIINMKTTIDALTVKFNNYLPLLGGTMLGTINGKAINATSFTNSGVTTLNNTVNVNATMNAQNIEATRLDSNGGNVVSSGGGFLSDGGDFNSQGGRFLSGGGEFDAQGGKIYAETIGLENAGGTGKMSVFKYRNSTSIDVLKNMYLNGNSIFTENGNITTGTGEVNVNDLINLKNNGQLILNRNATQSILMPQLPDNSARSFRVTHTNGNNAGDLIWDRTTNGSNAVVFRLLSVTSGASYAGVRGAENTRLFNYGTGNFVLEATTFALAQVQTLNNQLSTQEQLDNAVARIDALEQSNNLLQLQMQAIINNEPIPTSLPQMRTARMTTTENQLTVDLRVQLDQAQLDLLEEEYNCSLTKIDSQIEGLESIINSKSNVVYRSAKEHYSEVGNLQNQLDELKAKKEELIFNHESEQ